MYCMRMCLYLCNGCVDRLQTLGAVTLRYFMLFKPKIKISRVVRRRPLFANPVTYCATCNVGVSIFETSFETVPVLHATVRH